MKDVNSLMKVTHQYHENRTPTKYSTWHVNC